MPVEMRPLAELDPDAVQAALAETVQRVQEDNPNLDLRRGVFAELLAYYHAVLDTQRRTFTNDVLNSRSLKVMEADPTLADPDLVDDVLSNFRVSRQLGRKALGEVTVVVADDVTVTIAQGSVWEARGRQFLATRVFTAKAEAAQVNAAGDRLLTETADGNFAFTIQVEAAEEGSDYTVTKDTLVAPLAVPPAYVTSYAAADFTPGFLPETNAEVLARLQEGYAAKALSNRVNMAAALRQAEAFARLTAMSIVGHGDAELVRAFHSVLPVALGGRCDWYVRSQEQATQLSLTVTATLVEKFADGTGTWQFAVGRDDAPGLYEVRDVRPVDADPAAGGFGVTSDVRGLDLTGDGWKPDVVDAVEAAYSAYSTAVVQFLDTTDHAALAVGDAREYTVGLVVMPQVADMQALVGSRDVRPYGGDVLVKAPVPCFLTVNFTVNKKTGQPDPDVDSIKAAVAKAANTVGFAGALYASQIQAAVSGYLTDGQTVSAIDMFGRLRYPDGTTVYLRDSEVLQVPDDPANMVSPRTVQFFNAPEDVGVTVVTKLPTDL
jgi:hypothetical protein